MKKETYIKRHAYGTIWAKGTTVDGVANGYFEWLRKYTSKLRSGYFKDGEQTGIWTTYDRNEKPFKTTGMSGKGGGKEKTTL
jgi:hypothetical protein